MKITSSNPSEIKTGLHPRNIHRERYDFDSLVSSFPSLEQQLKINKFGDTSIDFADPIAVKSLNTALLLSCYRLKFWSIPSNFLCPPIPGRADYLHYLADLMDSQVKLRNRSLRCLDIGTGANCIYPLLGVQIYNWDFVGVDCNEKALEIAQKNISNNDLNHKITLRKQEKAENVFDGIILPGDYFDLTMCNPPFHSSAIAAKEGSVRKIKGLTNKNIKEPVLNFGGQENELWCEGGEFQFIKQMILQSVTFAHQCLWFTTLVSKKEHLKPLEIILNQKGAKSILVLPMQQGNKMSRILAWSFNEEKV